MTARDWKTVDAVWGAPLPHRQKIVLLALLRYGKRAFPKQGTLAEVCGMGQRTVCRIVDELRQAGWITTRGTGKSLTYLVAEPRQTGVATCAKLAQEVRHRGVAATPNWRRDPNPISNPIPNPTPATPAGGWVGVDSDTVEAIRARDNEADARVEGQRKGVLLRLLANKVTQPDEVAGVWRYLVGEWAATGRRPFEALEALLADCAGARDTRRVLLYRLRGAA